MGMCVVRDVRFGKINGFNLLRGVFGAELTLWWLLWLCWLHIRRHGKYKSC